MNIIPSYNCNFNCPFCITHKFDSKLLLDLIWLKKELDNINNINHLNIIGGEPTLLDKEYLNNLIDICYNKINDKPDLYTNLSLIIPEFNRVKLHISVNPWITNQYKIVLNNILQINQNFEINTVVTNELLKIDYINIINKLLSIKCLNKLSLSFYSYFDNFNLNNYTPKVDDYLTFIDNIIKIKDSRLHFFPIDSLKHNLSKNLSPENCIEILPNKKYRISIRDFINTKIDIFKEYNTWNEASDITKIAINKYLNIYNCNKCKYCNACQRLYDENTNIVIMKKIEENLRRIS